MVQKLNASLESPPELEEPLPFFVYVIESPSASDAYWDRSERDVVKRALWLHDMHCSAELVTSAGMFRETLNEILTQARRTSVEQTLIIHISSHGNEEGLQLTNGDTLTWGDLRELLLPICRAVHNRLLLCMSGCGGYLAVSTTTRETQTEYPFYGMIGTLVKPEWSDTAVAYSTFYHLLAKGHKVIEAKNQMNEAAGLSGDTAFECILGYEPQIDYLQCLRRMRRLMRRIISGVEHRRTGS